MTDELNSKEHQQYLDRLQGWTIGIALFVLLVFLAVIAPKREFTPTGPGYETCTTKEC